MKRNYYIFSSGKLIRKNNTLYFEPGYEDSGETETGDEEEFSAGDESEISSEENDLLEPQRITRKPLPVEDIEAIFAFGEIKFNTRFINFCATKGILLHFYNYYGNYTGSFIPKETLVSGKLTVNQVAHYVKKAKRVDIASKLILGASANILKNLNYYNVRDCDLKTEIETINNLRDSLQNAQEIREIMGIEGNIRQVYYQCWNKILNPGFHFDKRSKQPPLNPINALISFGNSLVYNVVLSELYKTQLTPTISFLHEPGTARYSLSLDLAEIFKPLLTDRIIFSVINKGIIQQKHFTKELNFCHLKEDGRKIFLKEFDEKLKTTIKHRTLKRSVSYRQLIRLEAYKLIKHLLGDKEYKPFVIWW